MPTKIEWTEETWNPVIGCSHAHTGCLNCYAEKMAARLSTMPHTAERYTGLTSAGRWTGAVRCLPEVLDKPLRRRKPTTYFVPSMGDLFHEEVPDDFIAAVFGIMARCSRHRFVVLTKRPERMCAWFEWIEQHNVMPWTECHWQALRRDGDENVIHGGGAPDPSDSCNYSRPWPLPNLILGSSFSDQPTLEAGIDDLLATPAACRVLSLEPLVGLVDLSGRLNGVGWVIVGAESGPGSRFCSGGWVRSVVKRCREAGVPVFVKQVHISGRVSKNPAEWPEDLRVREYPAVLGRGEV